MLLVRVPSFSINKHEQILILQWYRPVGSAVGKGVILVDLQVDSNIFSLSSPGAGILEKILVPKGRLVGINEVIAVIRDGLPVFDPAAILDIEEPYVVPKQELTVSSSVALQQLLADRGSKYASRIQSLPPKWESQIRENNGLEAVMENHLEIHPLLADKCWRKEEHIHPSDLDQESLDQAELRYDLNYQSRPSKAPTPRPY